MRDVGDVDTFGHHDLEDRVTEQFTGAPDRDRAEPGDLTPLVTLGRSTYERAVVDPDQSLMRGGRTLGLRRFGVGARVAGAVGHLDERVERACLDRLNTLLGL